MLEIPEVSTIYQRKLQAPSGLGQQGCSSRLTKCNRAYIAGVVDPRTQQRADNVWHMDRARSRIPIPQIHGKGKAFPLSKYGCRLACAEIINHNFILPGQCSLRPLPDRDSHPLNQPTCLFIQLYVLCITQALSFQAAGASPLEDTSHRLQLSCACPSFLPIPQSGQPQSHVGCRATGHHHKFRGLAMELQV